MSVKSIRCQEGLHEQCVSGDVCICSCHSSKILFSYAEIDERCCELGAPEYVKTDDEEAWYWRFSGSKLPVADTLAELLLAARRGVAPMVRQ